MTFPTQRFNISKMFHLGEFLNHYELEQHDQTLLPRGIINSSTFCYVNATIQALLACAPFYNLLRAIPPQLFLRHTLKSATPVLDSLMNIFSEFDTLMNTIVEEEDEDEAVVVASPKFDLIACDGCDSLNEMSPIPSSFIYELIRSLRAEVFSIDGGQEDAEEFLSYLLNSLHEEMVMTMKFAKNISDEDKERIFKSISDDEATLSITPMPCPLEPPKLVATDCSPITAIFRGQLRCHVQREGNAVAENVQPFFTLQLDVQESVSVTEALKAFVRRVNLEDSSSSTECWQQFTFEELPLLLLLHFKCFSYEDGKCTKTKKSITHTLRITITDDMLSPSRRYTDEQKQYKLVAVIYHEGKRATEGHYVTDAYHVGAGDWVRYNDSCLKTISEEDLLMSKLPTVPYLLFYRRCDSINGSV